MTLVLTVIANRFVVQVSDRLTTVSGHEYDPRANKTILFVARDGVFTASYSGLAYLDGAPSDEWIASQLVGMPLAERGFGGAPWRRVPDIGLALIQLCNGLKDAYMTLRPAHRSYWYTGVAGWQGANRARRTIAYEVTNRLAAEGKTSFRWAPVTPRPTIRRSQFALLQSPHVLTADEISKLRAELRDGEPGDPHHAEGVLVTTVQSVAARSKLVGPHCMSIVLSPEINPRVRCRFVPGPIPEVAKAGAGAFEGKPQTPTPSGDPMIPEGVPIGYSPLIIAPHWQHSPSVMVGAFVTHLGGLAIALEGPDPKTPRTFLGSQARRPPP